MPNTRIKAATNAEHDAAARTQPWHGKRVLHRYRAPPPRVVTLSTATSLRRGYFTMLPLNKFLGIDYPTTASNSRQGGAERESGDPRAVSRRGVTPSGLVLHVARHSGTAASRQAHGALRTEREGATRHVQERAIEPSDRPQNRRRQRRKRHRLAAAIEAEKKSWTYSLTRNCRTRHPRKSRKPPSQPDPFEGMLAEHFGFVRHRDVPMSA